MSRRSRRRRDDGDGGRSGQAAQQLAAQGFTHLYNLAGGMLAVERAGLHVEGRSAPGAAQPA